MNHRMPNSLVLALTRREKAELSDLRHRIISVRRVLNKLVARRNYILSRVPDHNIIVPKIPNVASKPTQPKLL